MNAEYRTNILLYTITIMIKTVVEWLDGQTTNESQNIVKEIEDVAWTVHNQISEYFQENEESVEMAKATNPFPEHKWYTKLRNKITPDQQKKMKENICISTDGKIEIIKMKKKFAILTAEHNGKNIFRGEREDQYGKKWIAGVTYLTGRAAEQECDKQKKILLQDKEELEQFISYFPGETEQEKIFNFVSLFGLEKTGWMNPSQNRWYNIETIGFAVLSRVNEKGFVSQVKWDDDRSNIGNYPEGCASPVVACEDC